MTNKESPPIMKRVLIRVTLPQVDINQVPAIQSAIENAVKDQAGFDVEVTILAPMPVR